jgi:hypothetical protein
VRPLLFLAFFGLFSGSVPKIVDVCTYYIRMRTVGSRQGREKRMCIYALEYESSRTVSGVQIDAQAAVGE